MGNQERHAPKADKTAILNKFCAVCGYHRKYALRLLRPPGRRSKTTARKPGPASRYAVPELVAEYALRRITQFFPESRGGLANPLRQRAGS
jgi:hypothetical protein